MKSHKSGWIILLAGVLLSTAGCSSVDLRLATPNEIDQTADEVVDESQIVVLVGSLDAAVWLDTQAYTRGYKLQTQETLSGLGTVLMRFQVPPGLDGAEAIRELERIEPSATAGVNHRYSFQSVADGENTALKPISGRRYANAMVAWPASGCTAVAPVGIIDTSIDRAAPALKDVEIQQAFFSDGGREFDSAHGTAIAELLAGNDRLQGARLFNAVVISEDRSGNPSTGVDSILQALDWLMVSGVRIINLSLAGPYNKILDQGIGLAARNGALVVAAAGNGGANSPLRYPAAFPEVIAVTAVDARGQIYDKAVNGPHIDFSAPGVDVFVSLDQAGRYMTGTSIAAPFVTSRIAADPQLASGKSAQDVRQALERQSLDLGAEGNDPVFGAGLVNSQESCQ